jgi:dipeptidase E
MKLLLIGGTGRPYFEHCKVEMAAFLESAVSVGFVTGANLFDEAEYFRAVESRLTRTPPIVARRLVHIRWDSANLDELDEVDAVIVGGGNTYALLKRLRQSGLFEALRTKVLAGLPYVGSSAGANIAGPNILTTNDWNVVGLTEFRSLALVPFNLNPHYVERGTFDAQHSETRSQRIKEYHQVQHNPVVAIEEETLLNIAEDKLYVSGRARAKVFLPNNQQCWLSPGQCLSFNHSGIVMTGAHGFALVNE